MVPDQQSQTPKVESTACGCRHQTTRCSQKQHDSGEVEQEVQCEGGSQAAGYGGEHSRADADDDGRRERHGGAVGQRVEKRERDGRDGDRERRAAPPRPVPARARLPAVTDQRTTAVTVASRSSTS